MNKIFNKDKGPIKKITYEIGDSIRSLSSDEHGQIHELRDEQGKSVWHCYIKGNLAIDADHVVEVEYEEADIDL